MGLRCNGSTTTGVRTATVPATTACTVAGFVKLIVSQSDFTAIFAMETSGVGHYIETAIDGQTLEYSNGGAGSNTTASSSSKLILGQWYFVALTIEGTGTTGTATLYWKAVGGGTIAFVKSAATVDVSHTPTGLNFGEDNSGAATDSYLNGSLAGWRFWDSTKLSVAELDRESRSIRAARRANLTYEWPFKNDSDLRDRVSANLLSGTAAQRSAAENPPVAYFAKLPLSLVFVVPAAAATNNPQAIYPDVLAASGFIDGWLANRRIDPATFQPVPSTASPQPNALGGVVAALLEPTTFVAPPAATFVPQPPATDVLAMRPMAHGWTTSQRIDPASFEPVTTTSYPQPWSSGRYNESVAANRRIDPATFQPNPSAAYAQPWNAGTYAQSLSANRWIDPAIYQPTPSAIYAQPWSDGRYADSLTNNRWVDPATYRPTPSAVYTQPWSAGLYAQSVSANRWINPATFQPNPSAVFVQPWADGHYAQSDAISRWIDPAGFRPNPGAVYSQPWSSGAYAQSSWGAVITLPPAVIPSASYPQRQPDQWHLDGQWVTPRWIDPAQYRPTPSSVYAQPWSADAYAQSTWGHFIAAPPAVNPSAVYPQRQPDQWHAPSDFVTPKWVDPVSFRPVPSPTYPQRQPEQWRLGGDWATPKWVDQVLYHPTPSGVFPQPWNAGAYAQSVMAARWIDPASFRPSPSAQYAQPWSDGRYRQSEALSRLPLPPPNPSASYSVPWSAGRYAQSTATPFVLAPVVVLPSAVYPQRQPDQWHLRLDWSTSQRIDPAVFQPQPSGVYPSPWNAGAYSQQSYFGVIVTNHGVVVLLAPVRALDPTIGPVAALNPELDPITTLTPTIAPTTTLDPALAPISTLVPTIAPIKAE